MSKANSGPLQNVPPGYWLNLGLAGLLLFYAIYTAWLVLPRIDCARIGGDFCQYLGGGRVANGYGYAHIYDSQLPAQTQSNAPPSVADPSTIAVQPFPYIPVFVLPFQLLSLLGPGAAFWTWTVLNVATLVLYLQTFVRRLNLQPAPNRLLLMILACLPVYMNVWTGQMNVWLVICVGEFMLALLGRHSFRGGFWLGGLLLKPQMLVLIGMILLLHRSWQILAGLAASSAALAIACFLLVGPAGSAQMMNVWFAIANGEGTVWAEGMMNWRMWAIHLSSITNPWLGWGLAGAGMLATLIVTAYVWRRPFNPASSSFPLALLGILTATTMITWHAHIHEAVILIPPIIYLYQTRVMPQKVLDRWIFLPAFVFLGMVFVPETMMKSGIVSADIRPATYFFIGASEFAANLYLFWFAINAYGQSR